MVDMKSSRRAILEKITLESPRNQQKQADSILLKVEQGIHPGLWLDKYIANLERYKAGGQNDADQSPQQNLVNDVAELKIPEIYPLFYKHWQQCLQEAGASSREFVVKGRMAVGLGNESVLETSIALHPTYGVPYIPGSALKGLAASYARLMAGDDWQQGKPAYKAVFGDTEDAGYITFFDALYIPANKRRISPAKSGDAPDYPLRADIITVHHPEYYKGEDVKGEIAPPADWDSPNPVPFLSATGSYLVAIAAPDLDDPSWIEKVFELLEQGLLILGIGAKTSSGYGRMEMADRKGQTTNITPIHTPLRSLPDLKEGQQITGVVVNMDQRSSLQGIIANGASSQFLFYRDTSRVEYPLAQIVIVISSDFPEALNWKSGDQRNCRVQRLEKLNGRLIVVCEPVAKKTGDKKKKR